MMRELRNLLLALWAYRYFILTSIRSELQRRFARSRMGALWFILHPLVQASIFAVLLSEVLPGKLPGVSSKVGFAVYLMAGMAAWGLFAEISSRCTTVFIEYSGMVKKIVFPKACLPVIVGGSALINHVLLLAAIMAVFLCFGHVPGGACIILPVGALLIAVFAFGLGIFLGVFNVFNRDVGQVFTVAIQIWFWLTPIVYPASALPKGLGWLVYANPMAPLVKIYQDALLYNTIAPDWDALLVAGTVSLLLCLVSLFVFLRGNADLVDAL